MGRTQQSGTANPVIHPTWNNILSKGEHPPPPLLTLQFSRKFKNQSNIGWLQSLMGLLSHDWAYIQNLYLQSLGAKVTGHIWIYSLIRILWDTNWDICNYMNHNLHAKDGPTEIDILACINTVITYHPLRGMTGLPQI